MTLKVVQFDPFALTPYYNIALCQALAGAGCYVRYVTSRYAYDAIPDSKNLLVEELYFPQQNSHFFCHWRKGYKLLSYVFGHHTFLKSLEANRPDVVHFQWSRVPLFDLLLVRRIKALGIPIVHTIHDVEPLFDYSHVQRLAAIYQVADKLIVHGQANLLDLLKKYPFIDKSKVQVIPHILPAHSAAGISRTEARNELNIPQDSPVILFYGSIRKYKHLENLIEAYLLAREKRSDLWIIVAGLQTYKEIDKEIRKLKNQALIYSKYIPMQRVELYHQAANIAVFPYKGISQSGALVTAMGFGLPVIVTNVGAMPETVCGNGWVVGSNNPEALASALLEASSDKGRLEMMGRRSLELISERHSSEAIGNQTLSLYERIVSTI